MSKQPPELNEKLLKCVLDHIGKHLNGYNQNTWADVQGTAQDTEPYCGTTGCVAGWTCLLTLPEGINWLEWAGGRPGTSFMSIARQKLRLTTDEADYLFGGTDFRRPKSQYREILRRVVAIKKGRKLGVSPLRIHDTSF